MKRLRVLTAAAVFTLASCGGDSEKQAAPAAGTTKAAAGITQPTGPTGTTAPTQKRSAKNRSGRARRPSPRKKERQRRTRHRTPRATTRPKRSRTPTAGPRNAQNAKRLKRYLRENFGGGRGEKASWYDHILDVEVSNSTTTVKTDVRQGPGAGKLADEICVSVRGTIPGVTDVVRVTGPPGENMLAKCVP